MRFQILRARGGTGGFRWQIKARNGEVLASSQVIASKQTCLKAIALVREEAAGAAIADLT